MFPPYICVYLLSIYIYTLYANFNNEKKLLNLPPLEQELTMRIISIALGFVNKVTIIGVFPHSML